MKREEALLAPSVGTWQPAIGLGQLISAGVLLGRLRRAGRVHEVLAPDGASGVATRVSGAGWLEYGAPLVTLGQAIGVSAPESESSESADVPAGLTVVRAETDGTIYLSPEPAAPAFAPPGAAVAARATLALVEVMKTFTPVRSPVAGTVERTLVASGAGVTAGDPLFWIRAGA